MYHLVQHLPQPLSPALAALVAEMLVKLRRCCRAWSPDPCEHEVLGDLLQIQIDSLIVGHGILSKLAATITASISSASSQGWRRVRSDTAHTLAFVAEEIELCVALIQVLQLREFSQRA